MDANPPTEASSKVIRLDEFRQRKAVEEEQRLEKLVRARWTRPSDTDSPK